MCMLAAAVVDLKWSQELHTICVGAIKMLLVHGGSQSELEEDAGKGDIGFS